VKPAVTPALAYVGIGANLGDAAATVQEALRQLGQLPGSQLTARSSLYRSAPVDAQGADFMNAVAELMTQLAPLELLHHLQAIEHAHGRERPFRNAPRTLDLDLLLLGDLVMHTAELELPHPRAHLRAFVLVPLAELHPGLQWPGRGPIGPLLRAVAEQRIEMVQPA
jgi:2-amino-4-hydroxy-6-hydroxymethyldihydropteridine diphosphokinase